MLKITEYADKLIDGLDGVDYIERVKISQKNWIGRSHGAEVDFSIERQRGEADVSTPHVRIPCSVLRTWYSPRSIRILKSTQMRSKTGMRSAHTSEQAARKSDFERSELAKDKTGVMIDGLSAVNPVNGKEIPIWISDYVLMSYGTGAIMAVPAHDERDWEFAKKFNHADHSRL